MQHFLHQSSFEREAPAPVIDQTHVLDPAKLWPNAFDCPDWPILSDERRFHAGHVGGREHAEERLQHLGNILNRGARSLRMPTEEERQSIIERTFRRGDTNRPDWYALGVLMKPLNNLVEETAFAIVEAAHVRGYLRKLDASAEREKEAAVARDAGEARRVLADYRATVLPEIEEINALSEAAARHRQRIADEKAFFRSLDLRRHVDSFYPKAVSAAHKLGLSAPEAPDFED
jgi:hypothetical protein